jgi:AcrR family transcriptional regulator
MGLRERKCLRTREAIVAAALQLFSKQGFENTSVEQIAALADVAPRTFYRYFLTKEDVLFFDTGFEATLHQVLEDRCADESDVWRVARAMYEAMAGNQEQIRQTRKIIAAAPALKWRAHQVMSRTTEIITEHLLKPVNGRQKNQALRARILAHCVPMAVRIAFFAWIEGGCRGSGWKQCKDPLEILHDEFGKNDPSESAFPDGANQSPRKERTMIKGTTPPYQ